MKLTVKLDADTRLFTMSRTLKGFRFLGTVQRGYEIGALAKSDDNEYFQINGDVVQKLNTHEVERALKSARQWVEVKRCVVAQAGGAGAEVVYAGQGRGGRTMHQVTKVIVRPRRRVLERV